MFSANFIHHRQARILRIEFGDLAQADLVAAAAQVRRIIRAEPLRSVRSLTVVHTPLTADAATALKQCALGNAPHIRASAMVGSPFWKAIAADVQARGREDLMVFDDEAEALEYLART